MRLLRTVFSIAVVSTIIMINISCTSQKNYNSNNDTKGSLTSVIEVPKLITVGQKKPLKYSDVYKIKADMTYNEVESILGEGLDIGSGVRIMSYKLEDGKEISIPFINSDGRIGKSGEELVKEIKVK